jgi:hypothetical protein
VDPDGVTARTAVRCPNCRYDRAGLPRGAVCPECGSPPPRTRDRASDPAAARARVGLGLATLAWLGIVGFGILGLMMGVGACAVCWGVRDMQSRQADPDPRVRLITRVGLALGAVAAAAGLAVFIAILAVL